MSVRGAKMENIINVKGLSKIFKVSEKNKDGFIYSLKSIFKREFKMVSAVNDINFSVGKGEIRGLIGPNGAGKSTTIKILSGILYPTEGTVNVMGFTPWTQREKFVRNIGVVLGQKSQLIWDLPAIDAYVLNKQVYKIADSTYKENLDYFIELLSIDEVIKRPVRQLSLGERMKCELVSSMLHNPQLVFLDEPTIGMDVLARESIREFIKKVNQEKNVTFILTTHDISDIENLCHNVTIINNGSVVYDDTIDNLRLYFKDKKIIEVKLSTPIKYEDLKEFKVQKTDSYSAKIEVDLSNSEIRDEINKIFEKLPVNDITIENIDVEEVIKQIYK